MQAEQKTYLPTVWQDANPELLVLGALPSAFCWDEGRPLDQCDVILRDVLSVVNDWLCGARLASSERFLDKSKPTIKFTKPYLMKEFAWFFTDEFNGKYPNRVEHIKQACVFPKSIWTYLHAKVAYDAWEAACRRGAAVSTFHQLHQLLWMHSVIDRRHGVLNFDH